MTDFESRIAQQVQSCVRHLKQQGKLRENAAVVLGCSTSEVMGGVIGHNSVPETGRVIAQAMLAVCEQEKLFPVFQCCEHLNRALVMEKEGLCRLGLTQVQVVPYPKAGGSVAAAAYRLLRKPAVAVSIQADAAVDIGDTLVGMHLKPVAVPLRMPDENGSPAQVGHAHVVMAYARLPYIGGPRARYSLEEE